MKVELDGDETWALMSYVVDRLLQETELADADRARIRRWRSEQMRPASEPMKLLTRKINEDLARALQTKQRSQIRRPDWV
jgi:hypothetical protein